MQLLLRFVHISCQAVHREDLQAVHVQASMPMKLCCAAALGHQAKAALPQMWQPACQQEASAGGGERTTCSFSSVLCIRSCSSSAQSRQHMEQQQPGNA